MSGLIFRLRYLFCLLVIIIFSLNISAQTKWYSGVTGNWDDPSVWTQDPSGAIYVNPGGFTPTTSPTSASDSVYILTGKTITVQAGNNNKTNAFLKVDGRLDLKTTTGHTFTIIKGTGRILLAGDNFPSGDATHFVTKGQGEGTVIYYGETYTLNAVHTFYEVEVNLTSGNTITLAANYTLNGGLTVKSGTFSVNNTIATARTLTINGNLNVNSGASITVGTGNAIHTINLYGNVTNNGSIDLANDAQYTYPATGAAKVYFLGSTNNTLYCGGITDFYRLFLNKGTDQTYSLSVTSTNTANFRLFGPVDNASAVEPTDGAGGWERLALVLINGTLKLGSNINIPILGANRPGNQPNEFHVPSGARLWIDGANVSTHTSGGGWRGFTLFGTLQISAGSFTNPSGTGGITYFSNVGSPGRLVITGGEIHTTQLKQADASGMFSYIQSGGTLYIESLSDSRASSSVFALPNADHTMEMSGGLVQISSVNTTTTNGIHILCAEGNYNITGGTFEIMLPTLDAADETEFEVSSTVPFYNLTLTESTNPDAQTLLLQNNLTVLNDLTIGANTELNTNGNDVSIGGDFNFANGATYTHGNNTTKFIGEQNSKILIGNTAGTAPLQFYNFEIEKEQYSNPNLFWDVQLSSPGRTAGTIPLRVNNTMVLTRGSFNTSTFTMQMYGDTLEIVDGTITNGTSGQITLTGSTTQHTLKGAYAATNQSFGNINLNNTNDVKLLSDIKVGNFVFAVNNGLCYTDIYNIEVTGTLSGFSNSRYFYTAGNSSDGGLTLHFTLSGTYGANALVQTFPVGTSVGYTRGEIFINGYTFPFPVTGWMRVTPVSSFHPNSTANPATVLNYYWVSEQEGFESVPAIEAHYRFHYIANINNAFIEHVLIDNEWIDANSGINNSPILEYRENTFGFVDGDFACGQNGQFNNRRILYSRGPQWVIGSPAMDWHTRATWSDDPVLQHDGAALGGGDDLPEATDICVVGRGHRINATTDGFTIGRLEFSHDTSLGANGFEDIPRVQINGNYTFAFGKVVGTGMFTQWWGNANNPTVTGDFGDFANEKYSWYLFVAENDNVILPATQSVFPNVAIENGGGEHLIFTQNVHINYNLNPRGTSILLLNNGATGDIYVDGNCYLGDWGDGKIQFPSTGTERTLTIMGNLDFTQAVAGWTATNYREIQVLNTTPSGLVHNLIIGGNIIQGVGILDLYNAGATANNVTLSLIGDNNSTFTRSGTERTELYRVELNKTIGRSFLFDDDFTLNGPTAAYPKALELINGDLRLEDGDIDITLSSGGADFRIPSTTSLSLTGESGNPSYIRISGNNTGLFLDGPLTINDDAYAWFNGGTNNYVQYSSSGSAQINIYAGELRIGSQLRRTLYTDEGVIKFHQFDNTSTVIIGETDAPEGSRGVFEILNSGSEFTQVAGANIAIVRQQTSPSIASLYFDPTSYSIGTGAGFTFGGTATPVTQVMGIHSTKALNNITVDNTSGNNPTLQQWIVPLTLMENLTIQSGAEFDANGLDLNIKGNFTNAGTFAANGNTTYFSGTAAQTITGSTTFYNLIKNSSTNLSIAVGSNPIVVTNALNIQSGNLYDNSNEIQVQGDIHNGGTTIYGGSNNGIILNGTSQQTLTGSGTFGKLTIDNNAGIDIPLGNNITITNALRMDGGILNIGKNLLTLLLNAEIEEATTFSATNMIQTNVSFTDNGVRKILPEDASTFIYPIGAGGKYTPVELDIDDNNNSNGSITVKAANEIHPTIVDDSEAPDDEIDDFSNVLQYYWTMKASGIDGFTADVYMNYDGSSAPYTAPYDYSDYITARLLTDGSGLWNKYYDESTFDETNHILTFSFTGADSDGINADYTAGVDGITFNGAIPDNVARYETDSSDYWTTGDIWDPFIAGGPRGSIAIINADDTVIVPANNLSNYSVEINGGVYVNSTFWHRFGLVSGTGLLYMTIGDIPAGVYDNFFGPAGGTIEFEGSTDYDVLSDQVFVNNLNLSGTGERRLPNIDLLIYGDLHIGNTGTPMVINEHDKGITIYGDLFRSGGTFDAGTGNNAWIEFAGVLTQQISGGFTGTNQLNILEINNPNGVTMTGNVDVYNQLTLTNGVITPGANILRIGLGADISPSAGSSSSHVNGELTKVVTEFNDFTFPIGKSGSLGLIDLVDISGWGAGTADVSAEYFFDNPVVAIGSAVNTGINTVSHSEYWAVDAPAGGESILKIYLDGSSDIANAISSLSNLKILGWNNTLSRWDTVGGTYTITGNATSGSITCSAAIDFDVYTYFTLGSTQTITLITASIISNDVSVCQGSPATIRIALTGGTTPWTVSVSNGSTTKILTGKSTSPFDTIVSPSATTTYTLTAVHDAIPNNGNLVGNIDVIVTVNPLPTASLTNNSIGDEICAGDAVLFTAAAGSNYNFYWNGVSDLNSNSSTYLNSAIIDDDEFYVVVTSAQGCSSTSAVTTINVIPLPIPVIDGNTTSCEENDDLYWVTDNGNSYNWSATGGSVSLGQGTATATILWDVLSPAGTLSSTETVSVTETIAAPTSCAGTDTYSVTIYRVPQTGPQHHIDNTWGN